jgi:hypothetical protein
VIVTYDTEYHPEAARELVEAVKHLRDRLSLNADVRAQLSDLLSEFFELARGSIGHG